MTDAGSGVLSSKRRADFEAHLRDCAACREEFDRVRVLLRAIDSSVSGSVAAEPSPQLAARIRQAIAEQSNHAWEWWPRSAWLTAVGICAVLAICFFVARTSRNAQQPVSHYASYLANTLSAQNGTAKTPGRVPARMFTDSHSPRRPALAAHRAAVRVPWSASEPEIIVEPGQMQAILQLVAATQRDQLDGANLLNSQKKAAEQLEIKPLVIAPLRISALKDEAEPSSSNGGLDANKSSLSSRSN